MNDWNEKTYNQMCKICSFTKCILSVSSILIFTQLQHRWPFHQFKKNIKCIELIYMY